ncbi:hypothetical protein MKW98_020176 [Papaver atlanticum]|uniref:Glutamate receptor n=1 Tax=Papaver atlanticum TaxID=357466 RepID=A0AAD4XBV6_9MAGN|nr:hypothetical protein MKW98_020176 [Papaver atlanticum]
MRKLSHNNCHHHFSVLTNQLFLFFFVIQLLGGDHELVVMGQNTKQIVVEEFKVGVVLDLNMSVAKVWLTSMNMALSAYYATTHKRRLGILTKMSLMHSLQRLIVLYTRTAAIDLIKNVEVQAIIGPMASAQAIHMVPLGSRSQVPIISFSATSPSISLSQNPYFIRTTLEDSSQVNAIAAIVNAFGWREVLTRFKISNIGLPYRCVFPDSASDDRIVQELHNLRTMQKRVFILHMTSPLGLRIFEKAKKFGMMSKGYSWIITEGLGSHLSTFNYSIIDSMQGVIAIRPYIPMSKELSSFGMKWKRKFQKENPDIECNLDILVEKLKSANPLFSKGKTTSLNSSDVAKLGVSHIGPELLQGISNVKFKGLSGEFHVIDRQLQSKTFQILNVIGSGVIEIGIWSPLDGIIRDISLVDQTTKSTHLTPNKDNLRPIIWPGDTTDIPKGWVIPTNAKRLRIGVPVKDGFTEFVKLEKNYGSFSGYEVTAYCIDVFKAALEMRPYAVVYDLIPFQNSEGGKGGSYDDLVYQDCSTWICGLFTLTTITANRSEIVDFTLPYAEGGVSMVVLVEKDMSKDTWVFLKPLEWKLWVTTGAFFFFFYHWEFRGGPHPLYQWGTMLSFSFSTLVFAQKERVLSTLGRFVIGIWLFVRTDPTYNDINELIKHGYNVGYQEGSFVFKMLKRVGFDESNLKMYKSHEEFDDFLSKGTNKGVLFGAYCNKYTMVGEMYQNDGLSFVFPKGSLLGPDISRKILTSFKSKRSQIDNFPSMVGFGNETLQNGNSNTARGRSTTLNSDYDIDIGHGYFTPTSEGDIDFENSTPRDNDSVSGVRNSTLHNDTGH